MEESSLVCALTWVRRGFAKKFPQQFQISEADMAQMKEDPDVRKKKKEMELEEDYDEGDNLPVFVAETTEDIEKIGNDNYPMYFDEDSEEEKEDYTIKETDALVIAGKIEKNEFSSLEIYLYEEPTCNLFVHHDITLSAFPLSLDWLSVAPASFQGDTHRRGNYAVVGSFLPEIEIWDLDTLDVIEPTMVLGGMQEVAASSKKKKGPKSFRAQTTFKPDSHEDAVLSVSLNQYRKEILASGSADHTVKLWDLSKGKCVVTYKHHADKVQSVKWHPTEESVLFSGSFDKKIHIFDPKQTQDSMNIHLPSDIECATWDNLNPSNIYVSTEDGSLLGYDIRNAGKPLFSVKAHAKAATTVTSSAGVNGMVATASLDQSIKLWDVQNINNEGEPVLVIEKNFKAGKINCGSFYQDTPWISSFGTAKGELILWDVRENDQVAEYFASRVVAPGN